MTAKKTTNVGSLPCPNAVEGGVEQVLHTFGATKKIRAPLYWTHHQANVMAIRKQLCASHEDEYGDKAGDRVNLTCSTLDLKPLFVTNSEDHLLELSFIQDVQ